MKNTQQKFYSYLFLFFSFFFFSEIFHIFCFTQTIHYILACITLAGRPAKRSGCPECPFSDDSAQFSCFLVCYIKFCILGPATCFHNIASFTKFTPNSRFFSWRSQIGETSRKKEITSVQKCVVLHYRLAQWNWFSDVTGCVYLRCIQWR